jgi:hypothetical protein
MVLTVLIYTLTLPLTSLTFFGIFTSIIRKLYYINGK